MLALIVLQKDVAVISVGCVVWEKSEQYWNRTLCAVGTVRRYICTEVASAEAEEINI